MTFTAATSAHVTFKPGDVIKDRYTLLRQIGAGTYGAIFAALYRGNTVTRLVAIKFEKDMQKYSLQYNEVCVMKALSESSHFAKFFRCGTHEGFKFVCMELLGPSLIKLVNRKRPYSLTLFQMLKFGVQAIKSLQELHQAGFIHRDVKPENFVIGNSKKTAGTIYLIDFGLCKRLSIRDGKIVKPTKPGSFRGTLRYASPNGHKLIELGRHDDLISLLYMMVEYYTGELPWSHTDIPDEILQLKERYKGRLFQQQMPFQFQEFENHIFSLDYEDEPNYKKLIGLMFLIGYNNKFDLNNCPFEWESELNQQRTNIQRIHQMNHHRSKSNILIGQKGQIISSDKEQLKSINCDQSQPPIQLLDNITIEDQYNYEQTNISLLQEIYKQNMIIQKQQHQLKHQQQLQKQKLQQQQQIQSLKPIKARNKQFNQQQYKILYEIPPFRNNSKIKQFDKTNNQTSILNKQQNEQSNTKEQDQIQQQTNQDKKIELDSNITRQQQQINKQLFEDKQQSLQSNNNEQSQIIDPHINTHTPEFIKQINNRILLNNKQTQLNQNQKLTEIKQFDKSKEIKQDSELQQQQNIKQNLLQKKFAIENFPLKRSISEIQFSSLTLNQQQQLDKQHNNENEIKQNNQISNVQKTIPKQSLLLINKRNHSHRHSISQYQIEIKGSDINNYNSNSLKFKQEFENEVISPKSRLLIVQNEQFEFDEQEQMKKPAFLDQSFTLESAQSKIQNFSNYLGTEQTSLIGSQKSSINQSLKFLDSFHSLNNLLKQQQQQQQQSSNSNLNQHYKSIDQIQEVQLNINKDNNNEMKNSEFDSDELIQQQQIDNNQNIDQSNSYSYSNSKSNITNIQRSQSNNDMQSINQNDLNTKVLSPSKRLILYDSNMQPKPIEVKMRESLNLNKQPSSQIQIQTQIRTTSPQGSQQSHMSVETETNSPFSTKSSQISYLSPFSINQQEITQFRSPSPQTNDNNINSTQNKDYDQVQSLNIDNNQQKEQSKVQIDKTHLNQEDIDKTVKQIINKQQPNLNEQINQHNSIQEQTATLQTLQIHKCPIFAYKGSLHPIKQLSNNKSAILTSSYFSLLYDTSHSQKKRIHNQHKSYHLSLSPPTLPINQQGLSSQLDSKANKRDFKQDGSSQLVSKANKRDFKQDGSSQLDSNANKRDFKQDGSSQLDSKANKRDFKQDGSNQLDSKANKRDFKQDGSNQLDRKVDQQDVKQDGSSQLDRKVDQQDVKQNSSDQLDRKVNQQDVKQNSSDQLVDSVNQQEMKLDSSNQQAKGEQFDLKQDSSNQHVIQADQFDIKQQSSSKEGQILFQTTFLQHLGIEPLLVSDDEEQISYQVSKQDSKTLAEISQKVTKAEQIESNIDQQQLSNSHLLSYNKTDSTPQSQLELRDNNLPIQQLQSQSNKISDSGQFLNSSFIDPIKMIIGTDNINRQLITRKISSSQLSEIPEQMNTTSQLIQLNEFNNENLINNLNQNENLIDYLNLNENGVIIQQQRTIQQDKEEEDDDVQFE